MDLTGFLSLASYPIFLSNSFSQHLLSNYYEFKQEKKMNKTWFLLLDKLVFIRLTWLELLIQLNVTYFTNVDTENLNDLQWSNKIVSDKLAQNLDKCFSILFDQEILKLQDAISFFQRRRVSILAVCYMTLQ